MARSSTQIALAAAVLAGCYDGAFDEPPAGDTGPGTTAPGGTAGGGSEDESAATDTGEGGEPPRTEVVAEPLHRLNRLEYNNTVRDLLAKNRAGWAHDRLRRAGLSSSPRRGFWKLSESGKEFLAQHAGPLYSDEVEKLAVGFIDVRLKPSTTSSALPVPAQHSSSPQVGAVESPDDRLAKALTELRSTVAAELLETLASVSPT